MTAALPLIRSRLFGPRERVQEEHVLDVLAGSLITKSGCAEFAQEVGMEAFLPPAIKFCPWCGAEIRIDAAGGPSGIDPDRIRRK